MSPTGPEDSVVDLGARLVVAADGSTADWGGRGGGDLENGEVCVVRQTCIEPRAPTPVGGSRGEVVGIVAGTDLGARRLGVSGKFLKVDQWQRSSGRVRSVDGGFVRGGEGCVKSRGVCQSPISLLGDSSVVEVGEGSRMVTRGSKSVVTSVTSGWVYRPRLCRDAGLEEARESRRAGRGVSTIKLCGRGLSGGGGQCGPGPASRWAPKEIIWIGSGAWGLGCIVWSEGRLRIAGPTGLWSVCVAFAGPAHILGLS